eukprot:3250194-Pyramimonas_sp.AAC.1
MSRVMRWLNKVLTVSSIVSVSSPNPALPQISELAYNQSQGGRQDILRVRTDRKRGDSIYPE